MQAAQKQDKQEMVRLGDIVEDPFYQVRMRVDPTYVKNYSECMKMGHVFPPLVLTPKTNKILSGFTRYAAYQRVYDPDYLVPVIYREFKTDKEALLFAARENSTNGQRLQKWDQKNLIQRLISLRAPIKDISDALGRPVDAIKEVAGISVRVIGTAKFKETKCANLSEKKAKMMAQAKLLGEQKPLKAGFEHCAGETMSAEAYTEMADHQPGWPTVVLVKYLVGRIENGLIDRKNEVEMAALRDLHKRLGQYL